MAKTIQCPQCGVVLNLPDQVMGKRLKCPKCTAKFVAAEEDTKNSSQISAHDAKFASMIGPGGSQSRTGLENDPVLPTSAGDLRDTFDLPMMTESAPNTAPPLAADALALFEKKGPARRTTAADARGQARRCPTCGSVVPAGMSLCGTCGLDLETGTRIDLTDDLAPEAPVQPFTMPIGVGVLGGVCALGSLILFVASMVAWSRGLQGAQLLALICLFGIYASVQFLRGKSSKILLVALTLGVMIDIITLIFLPIYQANESIEAPAVAPAGAPASADNPDEPEVAIQSPVERLNSNGGTQKIELGIGIVILYAASSVYLLSPQVRRHFRR